MSRSNSITTHRPSLDHSNPYISYTSTTQPLDSFDDTSKKSKDRRILDRIMSTHISKPLTKTQQDSPSSFNNGFSFNEDMTGLSKSDQSSYHFARIINQIVDKLCNDIDKRLSRLEIKVEILDKLAQNHMEKRGSKMVEGRIEGLEIQLNELKNDVFLKQSQISIAIDSSLKIFKDVTEVLNRKMMNFTINKDLEVRVKTIEVSMDEWELDKENQKVMMTRLEDDMMRMFSGMKDVNEIMMLEKINSNEIQTIKGRVRDVSECVEKMCEKKARSHR